jgi:hypothetical protein
MGCLLHALRTHRAALVALCLERYAHTCPDGDHDGQVARGYLFNCLQPVEPILGTRGSSRTALSQKLGAGAQATRSGPKAALSHEAGAGAAEARDGPELLQAGRLEPGTRGGPGAAPSREAGTGASGHVGTHACLILCLDLELVCGGTRSSGYRQFLRNDVLRDC